MVVLVRAQATFGFNMWNRHRSPGTDIKLNAYLKAFVHLFRQGVYGPWCLYDVNRPSRKPWALKLPEEGLLCNQGTNACREAKHFVEADRHRVDRMLCE